MKIYVAGPIGYETAARLYEENRSFLRSRFAGFFLKQFEMIAGERLELENASAGVQDYQTNTVCIREITEGGLFRALWEIGIELKCGLTVGLEAIPVRQEVIEILELFNESPYECSSRGSFVIVAENIEGAENSDVAEKNYAELRMTSAIAGNEQTGNRSLLTLIGHTTDNAARLIISKFGERYLTPPARQDKDILDRRKSETLQEL